MLLFVALAFTLTGASFAFGFIPSDFLGGGWRDDPVRSWLSPLASAFIARDVVGAVFNAIFLLIAGRFVEAAVGPVRLGALFVAGAYGGALARLILTPFSSLPSAGFEPSVFAIIGAYFMLYGVPSALPVPRHLNRMLQVGALALVWLVVQGVFMLAASSYEISVSIIDPLGGLIAGVLLTQPLGKWGSRKPVSRWG